MPLVLYLYLSPCWSWVASQLLSFDNICHVDGESEPGLGLATGLSASVPGKSTPRPSIKQFGDLFNSRYRYDGIKSLQTIVFAYIRKVG